MRNHMTTLEITNQILSAPHEFARRNAGTCRTGSSERCILTRQAHVLVPPLSRGIPSSRHDGLEGVMIWDDRQAWMRQAWMPLSSSNAFRTCRT